MLAYLSNYRQEHVHLYLNLKTNWNLELQLCLVSKDFQQEGCKMILILSKARLLPDLLLKSFLSLTNIIKHLLYEREYVKYYAE